VDCAPIPGSGSGSGTGAGLDSLREARAQERALYRGFRFGLPILCALYAVSAAGRLPGSLGVEPHPGLTGRGLVVSVGVTVFVVCLPAFHFTVRYPWAPGVFGTAMFASSVALAWAQPKGPGTAGIVFSLYVLARLLRGRPGSYFMAAGTVVVEVVVFFITHNVMDVILLASVACLYWIMLTVYRLGQAAGQAEELVAEMEQRRAAEARAAGLAERQRLAREMHDVLAHSLSGLMIQLEGARMLAVERPGDPRLPVVIDRAHHLGRSGLEEARRAIGMLRDDALPGPERLARLAEQFEQDRGVPCRFEVRGEEHELASEARLALYRVAQEALTNVTKHARPDWVELCIAYEPEAVRLTVEDFSLLDPAGIWPAGNWRGDGPGSGDDCVDGDDRVGGAEECGSGYGLTGMRERAELIGGTLVAGATRSGFRVELDVPA
jgi:signal transduction histidine kinase